jgi:phosphatidate cytidylyltransferase
MFDNLSAYAQTTAKLFGGTGLVLLIATTIAWLLRWRVAKGQPHNVIDNLVARINAWWIMVGVIGLAFMFGKWGVMTLFFFISFYGLREYLSLTYSRRGDHLAMAACFFIALPLQYYFIGVEWYGMYSIFIPVYAFLILPIIAALSQDTKRFLERSAKIQWGLMMTVFCISHVPALLTLNIPGYEGRNLLLIAYLVIVVQGSDVLQYIWGKLFGKRKVAPELSPSKTWEGLIGGVLSATLLGGALFWVTPMNPWQSAGMAFLLCLMGFFGGLVMSAIKRDRGVKDWGDLIEGHGGMLDRLDSIVFAAPIYFHVLRRWWTPD